MSEKPEVDREAPAEPSLTELIQQTRSAAGKPPSATEALFGSLLMGVGLLMVTLCGLCTGLAVIVSGAMAFEGYPAFGSIVIALMVGAIPIAIGAGLFVLGRRMRR